MGKPAASRSAPNNPEVNPSNSQPAGLPVVWLSQLNAIICRKSDVCFAERGLSGRDAVIGSSGSSPPGLIDSIGYEIIE